MGHRPEPRITTDERLLDARHQREAPRRQQLHLLARDRMEPHLRVHRGAEQDGLGHRVELPRPEAARQQIVTQAARGLGERVGVHGRDEADVGPLAEFYVEDRVAASLPRRPLVGVGEHLHAGGEGGRGEEVEGFLGGDEADGEFVGRQELGAEFGDFDGRNAARAHEQQVHFVLSVTGSHSWKKGEK